jgi:hypothetical protein
MQLHAVVRARLERIRAFECTTAERIVALRGRRVRFALQDRDVRADGTIMPAGLSQARASSNTYDVREPRSTEL